MIAKQFLITGIVMGIIGMGLSLLFRIQLAYPDQTFPFLELLLGRFAEGGRISPQFYLALVTIHGTIMEFFVLTAGLRSEERRVGKECEVRLDFGGRRIL